MAIGRIRTTYDIVTPESAAEGDVAESGWEDEEGVEVDSVAEAVEFLMDSGIIQGDSGSYYTEGHIDTHTGEEKSYGLHLHGFTKKNVLRVDLLLNKCERMDYRYCRALLQRMKDEEEEMREHGHTGRRK